MEIIPDKRRVVRLVEQANEGTVCLPNFQRDFVWSREEVADLVRSIVRSYFIGSLLLLRCDPEQVPFAPIPLRGAKPPSQGPPRPELLVLDGQQRLTSLLYALTAPNLTLKDSSRRRWYFLDLGLLLSEPDSDEIVFDRSEKELAGLESPEVQYERRILPCTKLLRPADFYAWRDGFEDWLRDNQPEALQLYRSTWRDAWTKTVSDFQTFEVPLVELPRVDASEPDSIGRVCAIFEKLNSTGVELSVYDLLTARLYRSNINLHDLWEEACAKHQRLREWSGGKADTNKFGVLVLRTLALLRGLEAKPRILIGLGPDAFAEDWRRAAAAMERALEILCHVSPDGFGVFDRKWLPGFGLLPVLAALRAVIEDRKLGEGPRADLRRWYWCNVFLERFSSGVESKSRKDYSEMLGHWMEGRPEPAVFAEARARLGAKGYTIRDSASYGSAVYSGVFCLLALSGAKDWYRAEAIQLQTLDDHHILPRAWLNSHGITGRTRVNSIVNRTLISDETNRKILSRAPAEYLDRPDVFPSGPTPELLAPHFIDGTALGWMYEATNGLSADDTAACYDEFCSAREATLIRRIREVCGVPVESDPLLEAPDPEPPTDDAGAEDREQAPENSPADDGGASEAGDAQVEPARNAYATLAEGKLDTPLIRRDDTTYSSPSGDITVVCLFSKPYDRAGGRTYWFGLSTPQRTKLMESPRPFILFGCGTEGKGLLVPFHDTESWLDGLSRADEDGRARWMFHIDENDGGYVLRPRRGYDVIDMNRYVIPGR